MFAFIMAGRERKIRTELHFEDGRHLLPFAGLRLHSHHGDWELRVVELDSWEVLLPEFPVDVSIGFGAL